jgi:hypothetical protein
MMASRRWALASVFVLGAVLAGPFHGTAHADVLVLDVCMVECNEGDWLAIGNLRRVLGSEIKNQALIASVNGMIARLGNHVPFPGVDDPALTAEQLTKHIKDGIDKWTGGDYEEAARSLGMALAEAALNPAIVVADSTLRPLIQRAYVARAVSLFRLNRKEQAKEAIADLVRMTSQPSILDTWGTVPEKVFQQSRNDLLARGTGALSIQVNDPTAVFYLGAAGQPHRGTFAAEMLPGVYQVFVTDTANRSRRYRVEVIPREHTNLNIDWYRDARFEVSASKAVPAAEQLARRPRIGFTFSSAAERRLEAEYATSIAAQVPGSLVVVAGRVKWEGNDAMIGAMYAPEQPALRVGVVRGIDLDAARDLAAFLMTDRPAPHVLRLAAPPWESLLPDHASGPSTTARWIIIGGGVVAIAVGASLYAIDRAPDRNTALYGVGLGIAGAAAIGFGAWFGKPGWAGPVVAVSSLHTLVGWAGSF